MQTVSDLMPKKKPRSISTLMQKLLDQAKWKEGDPRKRTGDTMFTDFKEPLKKAPKPLPQRKIEVESKQDVTSVTRPEKKGAPSVGLHIDPMTGFKVKRQDVFKSEPRSVRELVGDQVRDFREGSGLAGIAGSLVPGVNDMQAGAQTLDNLKAGKLGAAGISALGMIPMVGALKTVGKEAKVLSEAEKAANKARFLEGSAVKDVVYHGTPDTRGMDVFRSKLEQYKGEGFDDPDRAFFFTDSHRKASTYADDTRAFDYQGAEPGVIPAHLRLQNPMVIDNGGKPWHGTRDAVTKARAAGHDGVIIRNTVDDYNTSKKSKPGTVYVVFNSNQIKHATKNAGTFDPTKASILLGGTAAVGLASKKNNEKSK